MSEKNGLEDEKRASELFKRNISVSSLVSYGASDVIALTIQPLFSTGRKSRKNRKEKTRKY